MRSRMWLRNAPSRLRLWASASGAGATAPLRSLSAARRKATQPHFTPSAGAAGAIAVGSGSLKIFFRGTRLRRRGRSRTGICWEAGVVETWREFQAGV